MQEYVTMEGTQTFHEGENQTNLYAVLLCYKSSKQKFKFLI
jgi:hypothetical protein